MTFASIDRYADFRLPLWRETFAGLDWFSLRFSSVYAGTGIERGRGEAVIVVPGLFAADASTIELRGWLGRMGYAPYASGIGVNTLPSETLISRLVATIDRASAETGAPVRLVGHSLGGAIARGAALRRADRVSHVITLGSPVQGLRAHPSVLAAAQLVHGDDIDACLATLQQPLPGRIAETNVYTKSDGVVDWRSCFRDDAAAVEVRGTHSGLIVNADAYRAIANALGAPAAFELPSRAQRRAAVEARGIVPASSMDASKIAA